MTSAPIVLVPGFWLGAWAWDEVAATLRAAGHEVTALTLPGLESVEADRQAITLADHAEAIRDATLAAGRPVVLAVHSGAAWPGYMASDLAPESIAAMVYVDTFPATQAMDPGFAGAEMPLPSWEELTADPGNSIEGIPPAKLAEFRERAVPQPGAAMRDAPVLTNVARRDIPSTMICCAMTSSDVRAMVEAGHDWAAEIAALQNLRFVDLPTGHWPMWSRPQEFAALIGGLAREHDAT